MSAGRPGANDDTDDDHGDSDSIMDTRDMDDVLVDRHLHKRRQTQQGVSMRIQQTLDALGDDSAPSEDDEHEFEYLL